MRCTCYRGFLAAVVRPDNFGKGYFTAGVCMMMESRLYDSGRYHRDPNVNRKNVMDSEFS